VFESVNPPRPPRRQQIVTAIASMLAHAAILGLVVALPLLYFSETLPTPPNMLAFVVASAPPPPPPPPPPPAVAAQTAQAEPKATPKVQPVKVAMAAPVEAPAAIAPERPLDLARELVAGGVEGGVVGGIPGGIVGGLPSMPPPPPPPPPPAPVAVTPIRVGGDIERPTLLHRVNPNYPQIAISAKKEGIVILEATVGTDGTVDHVRVLRSEPLLDNAAVDAVKQWRYSPLQLNGRAHPFILTVTVSFAL
jgi:protein TonB